MKDLQPAMRPDTRYMKFRIHSEKKIEISDVVNSFWRISISYMGTKELSKAQPWLIANKFNEEKQEGVIRVNRQHLEDVRASLTLLNSFETVEGFITVEEVSGSISNL